MIIVIISGEYSAASRLRSVKFLRLFCPYLTFDRGEAPRARTRSRRVYATALIKFDRRVKRQSIVLIIRENVLAWRELVPQNSNESGTRRVKHLNAGAKQRPRWVRSYRYNFVGRCK